MSNATVRISQHSREVLKQLAVHEGKSMQAMLEKSIELYRRQQFLEIVNQAYAVLRQDSEAWNAVESERAQLDVTLSDGLDSEETWTESGKATSKQRGENHDAPESW